MLPTKVFLRFFVALVIVSYYVFFHKLAGGDDALGVGGTLESLEDIGHHFGLLPERLKLNEHGNPTNTGKATFNYNVSASGVYYPRPRRNYLELVDCGCPYSCDALELDVVFSETNASCREAVLSKMKNRARYHGWLAHQGEEFACMKSPECSNKCDPLKCKKPPLEDTLVEPREHFTRHEGVVIVTKIMGYPQEVKTLMQCLCLLTAAYNDRVSYDIVVFSTIYQWPETIKELEDVVYPAKFTLVHENRTVQALLDSMTDSRRNYLLRVCNKNHTHQVIWNTTCKEIGSLRYNWQAEFRSLHIWKQPELEKYRYMLWIDSDCFATSVWKDDPVDFSIRNNLVLGVGNMQGTGGGPGLQAKIKDYFNLYLCSVKLDQNSSLHAITGGSECKYSRFDIIHGFLHFDNLDFFRSNMEWMTKFIGEDRLSRQPDDQEAITTAALLLAPGRTRDFVLSDIRLNVMHNGLLDGKLKVTLDQYLKWWQLYAERDFPTGFNKCKSHIHAGG